MKRGLTAAEQRLAETFLRLERERRHSQMVRRGSGTLAIILLFLIISRIDGIYLARPGMAMFPPFPFAAAIVVAGYYFGGIGRWATALAAIGIELMQIGVGGPYYRGFEVLLIVLVAIFSSPSPIDVGPNRRLHLRDSFLAVARRVAFFGSLGQRIVSHGSSFGDRLDIGAAE